jgi:hypothetical protein
MMRHALILLAVLGLAPPALADAGPHVVRTVKDDGGWRLLVDGQPTMVFGMNWDYIPIGQN